MRLPTIRIPEGSAKGVQVRFGGLNQNAGAGDGELYGMLNMSSDHAPLLSPRAPRARWRTGNVARHGLFAHEELCWVDGQGRFYYGGEEKGRLSVGSGMQVKTFGALGHLIVILPDKAYYDASTGEFGQIESVAHVPQLRFDNGRLFGEPAQANALYAAGVGWQRFFRAGDAVSITGGMRFPEDNKTLVIREVDGDWLHFHEHVFRLAGENGDEAYTELGTMRVSREMPDLRFVCQNDNRLWGCDDSGVYASKPGDIFNWNVFEGLNTDSWAWCAGSPGRFTACASFLGHPVFFKEGQIYKVYGSLPHNFKIMSSAELGVMEGAHGSLAVAGERLYYLSRSGPVVYSGGIPQAIGAALGPARFVGEGAAGGSDGLKYYAYMSRADGLRLMYVYDTQRQLWHIEDGDGRHFAQLGGTLYFSDGAGSIWVAGDATRLPGSAESMEGAVRWQCEFGDWADGSPDTKMLPRVQIRLELDPGAECEVHIQYDSDGVWRRAHGIIAPGSKRSYYLPLQPRRADHYRLRISGVGGCRIFSLSRSRSGGSGQKGRIGE